MAIKTRKQQQPAAETVEETPVVDTAMEETQAEQADEKKQDANRLALLKAEQKRINAELRVAQGKPVAKPAAPKVQSLTDVVTRQRELPGRWAVLGLLAQANERVTAGQPLDEAMAQVAEHYVEIAHEVLVNQIAGETLQAATWRHLRDSYPRTNLRTGPGAKTGN